MIEKKYKDFNKEGELTEVAGLYEYRIMDFEAMREYLVEEAREEQKKISLKEGRKQGRRQGIKYGKKQGQRTMLIETISEQIEIKYNEKPTWIEGLNMDQLKTIRRLILTNITYEQLKLSV